MSTSAVLFVIAVAWIATGVLSYGVELAYWQREWPMIAERDLSKDKRNSILWALAGPINLLVLLIGFWRPRHGLKWR